MLAGQPLQFLDQLDAVQPGHVQIIEHQADVHVFSESFDCLRAGLTWHATVTAAFKKSKFFNNQGLIIDHKDFHCGGRLVHMQLPAKPKAGCSFTDSHGLYSY